MSQIKHTAKRKVEVDGEQWRGHRSHRSPDGLEFYNYPSALARQYWYHVLAIGRATMPVGYKMKHPVRSAFLLHYVRQGQVWHGRRNKRIIAGPGSVVLMDCGEVNEHGNLGPDDAQIWWLLFNGRDLPHMFTELRADQNPLFILPRSAQARRQFESDFNRLITLTDEQPPAYEATSFSLIASLLAELFRSLTVDREPQPLVGAPPVLSGPVRKGIDYITRFHAEPGLNLTRICEASGLSLRHFTRLFKAETTVTPIEYLTRHRVEQAKRLLVQSTRPIAEIGALVGASSPAYFAYVFKQQTGMTPRDFRSVETAMD